MHVCPQTACHLRNVERVSCAVDVSKQVDVELAAAWCGNLSSQLRVLDGNLGGADRVDVVERKQHRVAVCFYSLTRSLQRTVRSIQRSIFVPLTDAGFLTEVFLHTYNLSQTAAHSKTPTGLDWRRDIEILTAALPRGVPITVQVDDQARYMRRLASEFTHAFGTQWSSDGSAIGIPQFYLAAMHSLKRVTAMWLQAG